MVGGDRFARTAFPVWMVQTSPCNQSRVVPLDPACSPLHKISWAVPTLRPNTKPQDRSVRKLGGYTGDVHITFDRRLAEISIYSAECLPLELDIKQ